MDDNRVSGFYGMPIVDISASVGAGTGYYSNFILRVLDSRGYRAHYKKDIRKLLVVRPPDVTKTWEEHFDQLQELVHAKFDQSLTHRNFDPFTDADRRGLGVWMHNDIIVDLPTTAYALKLSPRMRSLNLRTGRSDLGNQLKRQMSGKLMDSFEDAIRYQENFDDRVQWEALSFIDLEEVPNLLGLL